MIERPDVHALVARAEDDYRLARSAVRYKQPITYGACFHAQQCAEKYLKAMLTAQGQEFPRAHDLAALDDLCVRAGILLHMDQDLLDTLTSYAVKVRYAGDEPTLEEARRALQISATVRRFARRWLGLG